MAVDETPDEPLDGWLDGELDRLTANLSAVLDLGSGLRIALASLHYAMMTDSLGRGLDLEAGSTAIATTAFVGFNTREFQDSGDREGKAAELLGFRPKQGTDRDRDRLEFRTHTAVPDMGTACGCIDTRRVLGEALDVEVSQVLMRASATGEDQLVAIRTPLIGVIDRVRETVVAITDERPVDAFDEQLVALKEQLERLIGTLSAASAFATSLRRRASGLAAALAEIISFMNDFRGADLSTLDLEGMRLRGVVWSWDTTWPHDWVDRILRASQSVTKSTFVITELG